MSAKFMSLVTTPSVKEAQAHYYGEARPVPAPEQLPSDSLTEDEMGFIQSRDSFYMSTVTETGWPYLQHRGGVPGFLRVLNPQLLAFADYKGNRQLLSTGNLAVNDRVALFFMDYPSQNRLKVLGHVRIEDARTHPELVAQLTEPEQRSKVERLFFVDIVAYDWNCSQYITPRFTAEEVRSIVRAQQQEKS